MKTHSTLGWVIFICFVNVEKYILKISNFRFDIFRI